MRLRKLLSLKCFKALAGKVKQAVLLLINLALSLRRRFWFNTFLVDLPLCFILAVIFSNALIINRSASYIYNDVSKIPENNVGLVLGTSSTLANGRGNLYFNYRIAAAAQLYHAGKVKHLIVSGDNHVKNYNEPEEMRLALIAKGVPDSCITLDFAGFRTLDSVVRCKKVFGQSRFTIISQKFHNQRALFIARNYGIDAVAFNAKAVDGAGNRRTSVREPLARFKAVLDLYIFHKKPKFLGIREYVNS